MIDDPRTPVRTLTAHPGLQYRLAAQGLNQDTGVAVVRVPHDRWRALLPADHLPGEIALAVARTKRGRPPVCLAVPASALGSADDEQLFQQLANASALALEALRTYNEEHALGLALQRSFLPKELRRSPASNWPSATSPPPNTPRSAGTSTKRCGRSTACCSPSETS